HTSCVSYLIPFDWKRNSKSRAAARSGVDAEAAAVGFDRPPGDRQPEAGAAVVSRASLIDPEKAIENTVTIFNRHARPLIRHGQQRMRPVRADIYLNARPARAV